nr:ethanolamine ammonia-lyase subunit EutC [Acinetobacter portensis]
MTKIELDSQKKFEISTKVDAWEQLKNYTDARIALGRAGCSIPTKPMLDFQLSHAQARDAVFQPLDTTHLQHLFREKNIDSFTVQSLAENKEVFLKRPDLGRILNDESVEKCKQYKRDNRQKFDVCIVIGDGLSALAIEENAFSMAIALKQQFEKQGWSLAPIIIATGSRVALGDHVVELLDIPMLVMMIGERPGLSSPDSMGIYYTWGAKKGNLDSTRNCISNIRPAGLSIEIATQRLMGLMINSKKHSISGVHLKDDHIIESVEIHEKPKLLF